ncbi:MAG: dienelactone hydrolase family protein [Planctomycetota bacterium]|nr:dienelactone hydrolase family protein [Planctomycetota bacterium]
MKWRWVQYTVIVCGLLASMAAIARGAAKGGPLPGTQSLTWDGDIASRMVTATDAFLLGQIEKSADRRVRHWHRDFASAEGYARSIEPNRKALARMIGVRDARIAFGAPELVATTARPALVGRGGGYEAFAVRWPVLEGIWGEGVLLMPTTAKPVADIVAIPDADQTPEQLAGLDEGIARESQYARMLVQSGCRVIIPSLVSRKLEPRNGRANLTHREFLYRPAYELGRHIIGYEVQKVLAAVDWFAKENASRRIGVIGYGEGGLLALYAAAIDARISAACVSGYFDDRRGVWQEPIDRNVFGLLDQFGDAELAAMVAPRALVVEACKAPELALPSQGGAPGRLATPVLASVRAEFERAASLAGNLNPAARMHLVVSGDGRGPSGSAATLDAFLSAVAPDAKVAWSTELPKRLVERVESDSRQRRQLREIDQHTQRLLAESANERRQFMGKLDTTSVGKYTQSSEVYRRYFHENVIGRFDLAPVAPQARSRLAYDMPKWTGYEVVLDVFDGVFAYGILLMPKDIKDGQKRPVVVCQHGLEGRPQDVVTGDHPAYHDFAAKLAERGFITFAPQNPYIFGDRFRTLQRKANPLGKTLFSIITPQHQQIVNWLKTLPQVDGNRIAFYGLSYGGKTAMRVPALVTDYCLSICSADFNEWVWKNASTSSPHSYVWTNEYEIFEFDLGSTFNYAEMAALIAPRPFMVERGHFDGVSSDEAVAYEFAKVRHLYEANLGIGIRCEIEFFVGPHTINGKGTFDFLHRHLNWPKR